MASAVDIANRALQKLGAKSIVSMTENSKSARELNRAYTHIRDAELEEHPWLFALKLASLSPKTDAPLFGYAVAYQLPADFITVIRDPEEDPDWEILGREIHTDQDTQLDIKYIRRVSDENDMTPLFREALAGRLAVDLAEAFTQSNSKKEAAAAFYENTLKKAKRRNAIGNPPKVRTSTSWLAVRS